MQPLADKLRPDNFKEFIGQDHIVGKEGIITKLLSNKSVNFPSLIFWGPPGCGKTTLARIIAKKLKRKFFEFSAVNTKTKDIEGVIDQNPVIFLDEIHRFNKAQQDKLLPHVEKGNIILIGATTENPSFSVISPLLSRSRVLVLKQLGEEELQKIINKTSKELKIKLDKKESVFLVQISNGDARFLITTLEIAAQLTNKKILTIKDIEEAIQKKAARFDKSGEEFYNTISAYIKSMRASNIDASLYYLARMVDAGQDPLYIARRMIIFASEDVATPTALVVANAVFQACQFVGYPECQENLAAGTVYLATSKKDRRAYDGYMKALSDVKRYGNLPIPLMLRNPVTKLMKNEGYGKNYKIYDKKSLLPEKLKNKKYYSN